MVNQMCRDETLSRRGRAGGALKGQRIACEAVAALAPMGLFSSPAPACRRQDHGTRRKQVDEPRAALLEG